MHFTLGISSISNTSCKRKRECYVISRKKKIFLEEEDEDNKFSVRAEIGKNIHLLIQNILKNYISYLEYFIFRENISIINAIQIVANDLISFYYFLLNKRFDLGDISEDDKKDIIKEIDDQIIVMSNKIPRFINIEKKRIGTKVIDDEFDVSFQIIPGVLCTGKVDLVAFNKQKRTLEFVEIKTGKPHLSDHRRQLKLYKETFEKHKAFPLQILLWNTKAGNEEDGFNSIDEVKTTKIKEMEKIRIFIINTLRIKSKVELHQELNREFAGEMCRYCPYCENLNRLFQDSSKLDLYTTDRPQMTLMNDTLEREGKCVESSPSIKYITDYL